MQFRSDLAAWLASTAVLFSTQTAKDEGQSVDKQLPKQATHWWATYEWDF